LNRSAIAVLGKGFLANRMNPVAALAGLPAFGWLWGMWGLLLGVPILLIVKTVCENVADFRAVSEMLAT